MSDGNSSFLKDELTKRTSILGLHLWVVLGISVGAAIFIFLFLISLWFTSRKNTKTSPLLLTYNNSTTPKVSREIHVDPTRDPGIDPKLLLALVPVPPPVSEPDPNEDQRIHIEIGKGHRIVYPETPGSRSGPGHGSGEAAEVSHLGWGHWYMLRELEESTNEFSDENVIGEGGYGIVYRGVLKDNTKIAVKNLLNNRYNMLLLVHDICLCAEFA